MLSVSDVYQFLLDEIRSDKRGLSEEPDEYNRDLRIVNQELFDQFIDDFEKDIQVIDTLGNFKVHNYGIDLTAGVGTLPTDYYRLIGKPRILLTDGTYRRVDLVTAYEHAVRDEDYLTQATTTDPYCRVGGVNAYEQLQIRVNPTTVTKVWIDYIKKVPVPFLDYMVKDDTYQPTFFEETSVPQSVPAGYTYRTGTAGGAGVQITSATKNLRFDDGDISMIITKLVNKVAKRLPDELLLQTSMAEQTKEDQK